MKTIWKSNHIHIYIVFLFLLFLKSNIWKILLLKLSICKLHNMLIHVLVGILLKVYTNQGNPRWRTCFGTVWRSGSRTGTPAPDSGPIPARHTTGTSSSLSENQGRQNSSKCLFFFFFFFFFFYRCIFEAPLSLLEFLL